MMLLDELRGVDRLNIRLDSRILAISRLKFQMESLMIYPIVVFIIVNNSKNLINDKIKTVYIHIATEKVIHVMLCIYS